MVHISCRSLKRLENWVRSDSEMSVMVQEFEYVSNVLRLARQKGRYFLGISLGCACNAAAAPCVLRSGRVDLKALVTFPISLTLDDGSL